MITQEQVLDALRKVEDPDLKKSLVDLNMIKNIQIEESSIHFEVELTTPACPLKEKIRKDCMLAIQELDGDIQVEITMTANVQSGRIGVDTLPNVKNVIAVASGKGGVGKSTVSTELARALSRSGAKVGLLDADIHGPSLPTMLGLENAFPESREIKGKNYIIPVEIDNLKVLSIGMLVDERQAIVWRGPMVSSALRQFIQDVLWGKLDYLIIDLPPGTGDVQLSLLQHTKINGVVLVTTPQRVALADARKAIGMFQMEKINVPILGVVENMAWFSPPETPDQRYFLFGEQGGLHLAKEYDLPFLGHLPFAVPMRERGDGLKSTLDKDQMAYIDRIAGACAQTLALQNAKATNQKSSNLPPIG